MDTIDDFTNKVAICRSISTVATVICFKRGAKSVQSPARVTVPVTIGIIIDNGYKFQGSVLAPVGALATRLGIIFDSSHTNSVSEHGLFATSVFENLNGYCNYIIVGLAVRASEIEGARGVGDCFIIVCIYEMISETVGNERKEKVSF